MRRKPWYLLAILLTANLPLGYKCNGPSPPPNNQQSDTTRSFHMEYDHIWSYDVFEGEGEDEDRVRDAFSPANMFLEIHWSNWISDEAWDYRDLKNVYVPIYAEITNGRYDHQCYLLALGEVTNSPDEEMAGETWNEGQEGRVPSFIFVYNIKQRYPGYEKMVHKCVIHELGHALALLGHLCVGSSMSPEHDLEDCVMAQGRYAQCTGWDVTQNLHFCNMCLNKIYAVKW